MKDQKYYQERISELEKHLSLLGKQLGAMLAREGVSGRYWPDDHLKNTITNMRDEIKEILEGK